MKTKCAFAGCFALISFAFVGTVSAANTKVIEQALRDLDAQWSATAATKDLEKTVSFYTEDAIVMPTNALADTSKETIRKGWSVFLENGNNLSVKTTRVAIAKSGDMSD